MKRPALFLFILITAGLVIGLTLHLSDRSINLTDFHLNNAQGANRPLGMPIEGEPDFRLHLLSPWQRLAAPTADRFNEPMGSETGALTYNAQPFWAMNETRGGHHLGDDINGIGGMNTDLGDPVYAAADGIVVYSGIPSEGWGPVLIVDHRMSTGAHLQTMYAHLLTIDVALGSTVARGQKIGKIGTVEGRYPAHLHYEFRSGDGVDIGSGYGEHKLNRLPPFSTPIGSPDDLRPSVHRILIEGLALRDTETLFNQLNQEGNREKLLEILQQK